MVGKKSPDQSTHVMIDDQLYSLLAGASIISFQLVPGDGRESR